MTSLPPISVALPIHRAAPALESAFACIASQEGVELEILVVLNGSDEATRERAEALARADGRVRVVTLEKPNLAAALNVALREARHELVARMDGDDACQPDRLRRQAEALDRDRTLAGVGCAYRVCSPNGQPLFTVRPPTDPGTLRWRLLLGNMLAHGSMMMRRTPVLAIGGYDESLQRAQDFDLWLRLSRSQRLAALPEVLYDYRAHADDGADRSGAEQSAVAAHCMLREWRLLPDRDAADEARLAIAGLLCRENDPDDVRARLAIHLSTHGPTRETLMAWTWAAGTTLAPPARALIAARRALVREVTRSLRERGAKRLWLYPAGAFVRSLLESVDDFAVPIAGVVDDHPSTASLPGWQVARPESIPSGEHLLLASDWHEDALWIATASLRARGVEVHRLHEASPTHAPTLESLRGPANAHSFVQPNAPRSKVA